ncbi:MAG TPA: hypothetical protein VEO53_02590, partial [Candidatus Binatia bacterium]|nr:hypothetical protein [Candidatus Binatia bacterium]
GREAVVIAGDRLLFAEEYCVTCVEDQPQRVGSSTVSRACSVLRLVEDDTAALRFQQHATGRVRGHSNSNVSGSLWQLAIGNRQSSKV